ncbi:MULTISPECIES: hypothetical protein [unclassified Shewanella]|nr:MULTISPECIES: hypothetical protein [unclassified Shewanella]MDO6638352.1 hypothetical protein [Shewanella sp. 5_MG-2023]
MQLLRLIKDVEFAIRPVEGIKRDIWAAKAFYENRQQVNFATFSDFKLSEY